MSAIAHARSRYRLLLSHKKKFFKKKLRYSSQLTTFQWPVNSPRLVFPLIIKFWE